MNIRFYFQQISQADKEKIEKYFKEKKLERLIKLLQHGILDLANLNIKIQYFKKHNAFDAKFTLSFSKKKLVGEEKSHDLIRAFDLALDRLISQLRKIESVRHDK